MTCLPRRNEYSDRLLNRNPQHGQVVQPSALARIVSSGESLSGTNGSSSSTSPQFGQTKVTPSHFPPPGIPPPVALRIRIALQWGHFFSRFTHSGKGRRSGCLRFHLNRDHRFIGSSFSPDHLSPPNRKPESPISAQAMTNRSQRWLVLLLGLRSSFSHGSNSSGPFRTSDARAEPARKDRSRPETASDRRGCWPNCSKRR